MKTPAEIVMDLMNETPAQTETRRTLARIQRESIEQYEDEDRLELEMEYPTKRIHSSSQKHFERG